MFLTIKNSLKVIFSLWKCATIFSIWSFHVHHFKSRLKRGRSDQNTREKTAMILTSILISLDALFFRTSPNPVGKTLTAPGKSFALICKRTEIQSGVRRFAKTWLSNVQWDKSEEVKKMTSTKRTKEAAAEWRKVPIRDSIVRDVRTILGSAILIFEVGINFQDFALRNQYFCFRFLGIFWIFSDF